LNIPSFQGSLLLADGHSTEFKGFRPIFDNELLSATPNGYALLNNLQGHRGTYYTGQLLSTSGTFAVWNQASKLIQQFFFQTKLPKCTNHLQLSYYIVLESDNLFFWLIFPSVHNIVRILNY